MTKLCSGILILFLGLPAMAQNLPPTNWMKIPNTEIYHARSFVWFKPGNEIPYWGEVWTWDNTKGYVKLKIYCRVDQWEAQQNGQVIVKAKFDPGHVFWSVREWMCQ